MNLNNPLVDAADDKRTIIHNPIQQLQLMAVELSGVSIERAYRIDEGKAIGKKLPDYVITNLCEEFYRKVYALDDRNPKWFRELFSNKTLEESVQDFSEYLMGRLGGRQFYTDRKGDSHCNHVLNKCVRVLCSMFIICRVA